MTADYYLVIILLSNRNMSKNKCDIEKSLCVSVSEESSTFHLAQEANHAHEVAQEKKFCFKLHLVAIVYLCFCFVILTLHKHFFPEANADAATSTNVTDTLNGTEIEEGGPVLVAGPE